MAVGRHDAQGSRHHAIKKSRHRQLRVEAGDVRGLGWEKAMQKLAPQEVVPVTLMGALLSSRKSSSLRKTKGSRNTQLGKPAVDMATLRQQTPG